ncbi:hypothetical protein BN341_19210 [Helicobacter heilmannii ASB1.4]|uniref:Uncharacterized protein n=1 Tax=Helicobacter heilmannii TaxID=35817 RepID=A0A0K2Y7V7_HELHE|nr:hypothetical protein BN341_19210 [Helicobacter heilmannii ASB1.4]CRI33764.1 hypothetical protein HHE01_14500 [Helicobacter heilmannii]
MGLTMLPNFKNVWGSYAHTVAPPLAPKQLQAPANKGPKTF